MIDVTRLAGSAGVLAGAAIVWIAGAYVAAPTIAERLVIKGGEIARCTATLKSTADESTEAAIAAVPKPAETPDGGQALRNAMNMLVGGHPGGGAYMRHYGQQFESWGHTLTAPLRAQADAARAQYDDMVTRLRQAGARNAEASGDVCTCRARAVINSSEGRSGVAWHVGSLGFVSDFPITDWQGAMRRPEIVSQCGVQS
ncbi:MAG TPA: hypothetical protein PLW75_02270 [Hyphomicrobium sp.]|nr:hypothetical protein [Hyphomicrobium sp.]